MKILVPIKRVPDYLAKLKLSNGVLVTDGLKYISNPFDEIGVEEALRIKEKRGDVSDEVIVISIGTSSCLEQVRAGLNLGADRGILVVAETEIDSDLAARVLEKIVKKENPDLIILGKQAIDSDANQTPQILATLLNYPQATCASKIEFQGADVFVTREVDGGLEKIKILLPAVISTDLRLNDPRYPSLQNIVKAKKKPITEFRIEELGLESLIPKVKLKSLMLPPVRKSGVKVENVSELVKKLKIEAKVI